MSAPDIRLREARRVDAGPIADLWQTMMTFHGERDSRFRFAPDARREFERHIVATMRSQGARVFVAEAEGRIVGYILGEIHARKPLYPIGTYGFISDLSVEAAWRRRGIGRALVDRLLTWFRRERVTAVELFVAEVNPVSQAFWRALGFGDYLLMLRLEMERHVP